MLSLIGSSNGVSAISVELTDLQNPNPPNAAQFPPPDFHTFEIGTCSALGESGEYGSCTRWVGPPSEYFESQDLPGVGTIKVARLQCEPEYRDWGAEGLIYVIGAEILPSSKYKLFSYSSNCQGREAECPETSAFSCGGGLATTARWGDVVDPYDSPSGGQPNGLDVVAVVNRFKSEVGALSKSRTVMQPNLPDLRTDVAGLDIGAVVDAFKGMAYPYSGPCPCPSTVTCNTTACTSATACSGGLCVRTCGNLPDAPFCVRSEDCEANSTCTVGNVGAACSLDQDCDIQGVCVPLFCTQGKVGSHCGGGCGPTGTDPCHNDCDVFGDCTPNPTPCGTGYCRDRCGRCTP